MKFFFIGTVIIKKLLQFAQNNKIALDIQIAQVLNDDGKLFKYNDNKKKIKKKLF